MNSNSHKAFSVALRAEIKRGSKMQYVTEVTIPVASMKEAVRVRQSFCDEIVRQVRLNHRRRDRRLALETGK